MSYAMTCEACGREFDARCDPEGVVRDGIGQRIRRICPWCEHDCVRHEIAERLQRRRADPTKNFGSGDLWRRLR